MDDIETAERRMRAHPAFTGGPEDEGYWLDSMQCVLASHGTYKSMLETYAARLERNPGQAEWFVKASLVNRMYWDVLEMFVREMWINGKQMPPTLITWWMDKTTGVINKKHHGKKQTRKNLTRDVLIAETVSMIHDVTDLPYEFDAPKSGGEPWTACHSVAKRLGMPYATVRSIWRKNRVYGDHAREEGLSPAARKRRRRR